MSRPESGSPSTSGSPVRQRLFFALWPAPELQRRMFEYGQSACAGMAARASPIDKLHMTLLFLGSVDGQTQDCLEQAVAELPLPRFELKFGHLHHRRRQQMLWLQPDAPAPQLQALVAALRRLAADCGLKIDARPFCAHVTLLRKLIRPAANLPEPDFVWPVQALTLVASKTLPTGAEYRCIKKWPLNA